MIQVRLLLASLSLLLAASAAFAQPAMTRYPGGDYPGGPKHTPQLSPFIDHDYFDVDWQWFAPAEVSTYGGGPRPNIGWYFSYDRTHFNVTRTEPEGGTQAFQGDATWGNRLDIGFMSEDKQGWLCEIMAVRGPNVIDPISPVLAFSINRVKTSGVELSKVWRLDPLHYGTIIEPMFGVRFTQVTCFTDPTDTVENNILGIQAGVRISHQVGHWVLSNETRFAACQNWQMAATGDEADFVPLGDIRFDAAYLLTREVALRFGVQLIYFGDGLSRADMSVPQPQVVTQDMLMAGFTFGFVINR